MKKGKVRERERDNTHAHHRCAHQMKEAEDRKGWRNIKTQKG